MTERSDPPPDVEGQDSDYDGAWKEALRLHLRDFLEKCFPALENLIDWACEPEWLDKEIGQIIGQAGQRNREVDLLFKVRLKSGREQWIFCHLEIQTGYEADFEVRVDLYNAGLKWLFRRDVLTLVILADLRPNWRPSGRVFELAEFESRIRFPICKVIDRLDSDWIDDESLPVQVARAQIAALRTAGDPEARFRVKTQLVRNLYRAGYNADDLRELFRLIDWMMHLRLDLRRRFNAELTEFEKEQQMPYVTSIERDAEARGLEQGLEQGREQGLERGLEQGRRQGREQGSVTLLLRQLARKCGSLPVEIDAAVRRLSLEQSQSLGEALLDFKGLDDVRDWLNSNEAASD